MASLSWAQDYAPQSVLSQGSWYKIAVPQSGVYRIDASFLQQLGLNPGSIDPRHIRIHGNGGAMLPQANATPRPDDLRENPIFIQGEADGSFDSGDHLLFYGEGAHTWAWSEDAQRFQQRFHTYADTNYYYLTVGDTPGLRIADRPEPGAAAATPTQGRALHFHQTDQYNPIRSGRHWLGESFDLNLSQTFAFAVPDLALGGQIRISARVAAHAEVPTDFTLSAGGQTLGSLPLQATNITNKEARYYFLSTRTFTADASAIGGDDSLRITLTYNKNGSFRAEGWLDWLEVEYDQAYRLAGRGQAFFSVLPQSEPAGEITLQGASNAYTVWDITDVAAPQHIPGTPSGDQLQLRLATDTLRRLIAFRGDFLSPVPMGPVANQDLHGLPLVDYLIISHPDFVTEAERLADFHRSHYQRSVAVVTPEQIYQEFSSGKQDVSAIRDFIRMFYVRSGGLAPSFVLLFGDGTYIYKHISQNFNPEGNFVPTYQSRDSWDPTDSYVSDDFFVMLDENDGYWGEASQIDGDDAYEVNQMDAAIGRLPVATIEEAAGVVDKIIDYATNPEGLGLGQWRNRVVLVADHKEGEGNTHVRQANGYTGLIHAANPCINIEKIYMDNYRMVIGAGQESFPDGRAALLDALDAGSLIVNYTGHGGEQAWSNAYIYKNTDIDRLQNYHRFPAVVTATCEYGRYDDEDLRSGAELMVLRPDAGAIAMFTTVRLVYSSPNETLNQNFYRHAFTFDSLQQRMLTMGEIMMRTKNATFLRGNLTNINSRNFTLLGDPGLILNYPQLRARITRINGQDVAPGRIDTLRSLARVSVEGVVEDELGNPLPGYAGDMDITVFDKPSLFTTRLSNYSFLWQKNRIFNGSASVQDGAFSFEFVVPIDISYEDGDGKISVYFFGEETDGAGCQTNLYVGGTDPDAVLDETGPEVELYMNDIYWQPGGMTGPNPYLYAVVRDENGINTVGSGIGHEITAVLDGDAGNTLILNDYYTALRDSYQEGSVRYQLKDLEEGEHRLRIRVWDVANNASEAETWFVVADDARLALDRILAAPNPFRSGEETRFLVGHNQDGKDLEVHIEIMSPEGRRVKVLSADFRATGNLFSELTWDGLSEQGLPLTSGVYIYRVILREKESGRELSAAERLVLLR